MRIDSITRLAIQLSFMGQGGSRIRANQEDESTGVRSAMLVISSGSHLYPSESARVEKVLTPVQTSISAEVICWGCS